MGANKSVLVLDTIDQIEIFKGFLEGVDDFEFLYFSDLKDAVDEICEKNISVVLVGCKINGHVAGKMAEIITERTKHPVHIILNTFSADTAGFDNSNYVRSKLFDIIWPTKNPLKIVRKIYVAFKAHSMEVTSRFVKGEITC